MRKQTLTTNQIETLKADMRFTVQYNHNSETGAEAISARIKQIDSFLKMAFDLHLIDDYKQVSNIMQQVTGAGLQELDLQRTYNS
jgi:hypothetical protein